METDQELNYLIKSLQHHPSPYIIYELDGSIAWANIAAKYIFNLDTLEELSVIKIDEKSFNFWCNRSRWFIFKWASFEEKIYSSNIIENVNYSSKDVDGNEYVITALKGEIDFTNPNIIYLTNVKAQVKLQDSDNIIIISDFGK